jgi:hypothetical protein
MDKGDERGPLRFAQVIVRTVRPTTAWVASRLLLEAAADLLAFRQQTHRMPRPVSMASERPLKKLGNTGCNGGICRLSANNLATNLPGPS